MAQFGERSSEVLPPAPRNAAVDAARLLFAFGVVVIHLAPPDGGSGALLARFFLISSVQFFFLISLYFFLERAVARPELRWSALHLDRILVPYATWTVLYTLFRFAKCLLLDKPFALELVRVALYGAGATHLYFLPLLVLWQALALVVLLHRSTPPRRIAAAVLLAAAGVFAWVGKVRGYYCFADAFPIGCIFVALAFLLRFAQRSPLTRRVNVIAAAVIIAAIVVDTLVSPFRTWLGPLAAYGAASLALHWKLPMTSTVLRYACGCSYAIYLAHLAFVEMLKLGAARVGLPLGLHSAAGTAWLAAVVCALCIGVAALARLHPVPRYLLLGEKRAQRSAPPPPSDA